MSMATSLVAIVAKRGVRLIDSSGTVKTGCSALKTKWIFRFTIGKVATSNLCTLIINR